MSLNVLIIGGVAAGPKAGCRIKRLDPKATVTMIDQDSVISYGGCGIPFYISGDVADLQGLMSTSFHMVRDPAFFKGAKGIHVRPRTRALVLNREAKTVRVRDLATGVVEDLAYDKLVIATGSEPAPPPIPGVEFEGVMPVANLHQAETIKTMVSQGRVGSAAVIGAGATGLEMAEALADLWGVEVHIFEMADQVLPGMLDPEMARMLEAHLVGQEGIHLHLGAAVEEILGSGGAVTGLRVDGRVYEAELVILASGVRPQTALAQAAGLEIDAKGGIQVDRRLRTSDPDIYAGGDCVALRSLLTGEPLNIPSGALANRMGRVIGTNICGGDAVFPGAAGTFCIKLFGLSVARTGLSEVAAEAAGLDFVAPLLVQADRAHFHPDNRLMYMKLLAERGTNRVLGLIALGENGDAVVGRVNAVAGMLPLDAVLADISNLEMAYSPPLGAAVDILNAAANTAENLLAGKLRPMNPGEFSRRLAQEDGSTVFLDMRAIDNAKPYLDCLAPRWVHLPQETLGENLDQVPRDRDVVLVCNSGVRSYEAQVSLDAAGITNTFNLSGGVAAVMKSGDPILPPKDDKPQRP